MSEAFVHGEFYFVAGPEFQFGAGGVAFFEGVDLLLAHWVRSIERWVHAVLYYVEEEWDGWMVYLRVLVCIVVRKLLAIR